MQEPYQVTNQVTIKGKYTNRYDVTLLVNGLPLVQIELKRRGLEMKEAFNAYWSQQKADAQAKLSEDEGLEKIIGSYLFTEKPPLNDDVISILKTRPRLKERKSIAQRIIQKIKDFVSTYVDGID